MKKLSTLLTLLVLHLLMSRSIAQDALPEGVLEKLKRATVFVVVTMPGPDGTGSGFLIGEKNGYGYIATNEHVVRSRRGSRRVQVVFNSGSKDSKSYVAQVVGEDKSRDLAILRIKARDLPEPLSIVPKIELKETLPVYILGFPFGNALSTSKNGPAVTIGRGTVSSIRTDDFGNIEMVQVDGDINPGNSGGPVVSSDGKLVGVSVATVLGTQIGMAIPCKSVRDLLFGRVESLTVKQANEIPGRVLLKFEASLIDPMGKTQGVKIHIVEKSKIKKKLSVNEDGTWDRVSKTSKVVKLRIDSGKAKGQLSLKDSPGKRIVYLQQLQFEDGRGKTHYAEPAEVVVRFPAKDVASKKRRKGTVDDSDGKDWLAKDDDSKSARPKRDSDSEDEGWLGTEADREISKGKPVVSDKSLVADEFEVLDLKCKELSLAANEVVPSFIWSQDGKFLFIVQKNGLLRKISVPELEETLVLKLPGDCSWLEMSGEGLCAVVTGLQELWVIDEKTLEPRQRIPIASSRMVATSPKLSFGFIEGTSGKRQLAVVDLKKGEVIRDYSAHEFRQHRIKKHRDGVTLTEFKMPRVSPDGKYFFCVGFECLHKFRIDGTELEYLEMGPRIGSNASRIEVSADSRYVALPSGGGNRGAGYGTYVYRTADILNPIVTIKSGAYPRTLGFDKKEKKIYSQASRVSLITFSPTGQRLKEYGLPNNGSTRYLCVNPKGGQVLVLGDKRLTSATFDQEE